MGAAKFDISGSLGALKVNDPTGSWDCHSPTDSAWLVVPSLCWALALVLFAVASYGFSDSH